MNDEIKELLKHIEILDNTDYILHSDKAKALLDYITNLQEEKDSLDDYNRHLHNELKDYRSRNGKAIEYVNTHKPSDTISFPLMKKDEENQVKSCFDYEFREIYQKDLLNILQGVSNENSNE